MRMFQHLRRAAYFRIIPIAVALSMLSLPASAATWGGSRSGLPWASGANGGMDELEKSRKRPLDMRTMFFGIDSWQALASSSAAIPRTMAQGGQLVIALGMLPRSHREQHEQCAGGAFDNQIRAVAEGIVRRGGQNAIIRLGWEANRMRGFPWAVTGNGTAYKACFRRWVSILRSVRGQAFTIDWNMAQAGNLPYHVDQMYPGNDVVDVIGAQQYDRCNPSRTDGEWQATYHRQHARTGSPIGLGRWLDYARSKGKRLSVPEWGVGGPNDVCQNPGIDNPAFIHRMFSFFRENAGSIAYEAYFNGHGFLSDRKGSHKLAPSGYNPLSAAAYRALWSSGAPVEPPPPPTAKLSIVNATYYGISNMCNARAAVAASCNGRSSCTINASDSLCGDPEPMVLKRLEIVYNCRDKQGWVDEAEGSFIRLECK
jgi:hypothetical protein